MREILIVRTSSLGDILHGLPLAAALKRARPGVRVTWLVEERYQDMLHGNPWIDRTFAVRFRQWRQDLRSPAGRRGWLGLLRSLRRARFDVVIDPQGLLRSGLVSLWSGAPVRIGFPLAWVREPLNRFCTNVQPSFMPARAHVIDRNLALLHPLGIRTRERRFSFHVPPAVEQEVLSFLERAAPLGQGPRVALHPGAGWPTKQWPLERFAVVARRLVRESGARVFVFWGPGEQGLADRLLGLVPAGACRVPELGIQAAIAFLRGCDLLLGGDSGPLHLASSLGRPVVGLYGPSDPVRNGPPLGCSRVLRAAAGCAPCYRRRCLGSGCMETISTDQVWSALTDLLTEVQTRR